MSRRRVVVTGMGVVSPIGNTLPDTLDALRSGRSGIVIMDEWADIGNLRTRLAGPVLGVERKDYKRKETRTMGRVAILAANASDQAIRASGLTREQLGSGRTGLAYGSSHGSSQELEKHGKSLLERHSLDGLPGSAYLRIMSHTCAVNLAIRYGVKGRILTTCSACTSSSQAIGYGFESIKDGYQDVMICGGAEELHFTHAGVFDILLATSTRFNQQPDQSRALSMKLAMVLWWPKVPPRLSLKAWSMLRLAVHLSLLRFWALAPPATANTLPILEWMAFLKSCDWHWPMPNWHRVLCNM